MPRLGSGLQSSGVCGTAGVSGWEQELITLSPFALRPQFLYYGEEVSLSQLTFCILFYSPPS